LKTQLEWLDKPPKVKLTPNSLKLLNSGAFYMFGRDKYYKLTIMMDIPIMIRIQAEDPDIIT